MKGGTRVLLAITVLVVVLVGAAVWSEMKPKAGIEQAQAPAPAQAKKPKTSHSSGPMFGSGTLGG